MPEREQVRRREGGRTEEAVIEEATVAGADTAAKLKNDLDDLLDEIDEVLEDNAEEFIKNYVQKGGE
ncbi:MAG: ubiquitin-like protein Pup [Actinomycetes bacterium]